MQFRFSWFHLSEVNHSLKILNGKFQKSTIHSVQSPAILPSAEKPCAVQMCPARDVLQPFPSVPTLCALPWHWPLSSRPSYQIHHHSLAVLCRSDPHFTVPHPRNSTLVLYFAMYNAHFFAQVFEGKIRMGIIITYRGCNNGHNDPTY